MSMLLAAVFTAELPPQLPLFPQGKLRQTGYCFDLAIDGPGFFPVTRGGETRFRRNGKFTISETGEVTTLDGWLIDPPITIPADTIEIGISRDGIVSALVPGTSTLQRVGQITLAGFINPLSLERDGKWNYKRGPETGHPQRGAPGTIGLGVVRQGYLERLPKVRLDRDSRTGR